jgi:hypothetical protein
MNETQELLINLIEYSQVSEHTKFEQLRLFSDYTATRVVYKATKKVVALLEEAAANLFKMYCKSIRYQQTDLNLLLVYKQLQQAISFYKEELQVIKDILKDFEKYMWEGDFLKDLILGKERDIWNLP